MGKLRLFNSGRAQTFSSFFHFLSGSGKNECRCCVFFWFANLLLIVGGNAIEPSWVGFYLLCVQWRWIWRLTKQSRESHHRSERGARPESAWGFWEKLKAYISFIWLMGLTGHKCLAGLGKRRWLSRPPGLASLPTTFQPTKRPTAIRKGTIKRIARRGGTPRIASKIYAEIEDITSEFLRLIIRAAVQYSGMWLLLLFLSLLSSSAWGTEDCIFEWCVVCIEAQCDNLVLLRLANTEPSSSMPLLRRSIL